MCGLFGAGPSSGQDADLKCFDSLKNPAGLFALKPCQTPESSDQGRLGANRTLTGWDSWWDIPANLLLLPRTRLQVQVGLFCDGPIPIPLQRRLLSGDRQVFWSVLYDGGTDRRRITEKKTTPQNKKTYGDKRDRNGGY